MAVQIETTCNKCGTTFQREAKRGRPALKCAPCRGKRPEPKDPSPLEKATKVANKERNTPTKGNDHYSRAVVVDLLESGEFDNLVIRHMADGTSKSQAISNIIKSIGG